MNAARWVGALCVAFGSPGCGAPPAEHSRFAVDLRAASTTRDAVAGVRFWADGRELGATDARGELKAQLTGRDDQLVALSAACPPSYRTLSPNRRLVLRRIQGTTRASAADFELTALCQPLESSAAVVVRARGPEAAGLPLRVGGEAMGQTELDGTAHLLVRMRPHSLVRVEIATDAHPALLPRNPVHTFQLDDEDSIFLIDQSFTQTPRKRGAFLRTPFSAAPPRLPYRIGSR